MIIICRSDWGGRLTVERRAALNAEVLGFHATDNRWSRSRPGRILPFVQGFADDRFAPVRAVFEDNLASGADVGASFCATVDGETVVDLWGGFADAARTRPWERDTIVNVYSTTKTMTALTALLLADRGELDFDAPVARYWPEFAANGKEGVKVSHLMSHSGGPVRLGRSRSSRRTSTTGRR